MKDANIILKVIEYLSKKGYSKTESMLRLESASQDVDGRPINAKGEETGGVKYLRAFGMYFFRDIVIHHSSNSCSELMQRWIDESLDIYKVSN